MGDKKIWRTITIFKITVPNDRKEENTKHTSKSANYTRCAVWLKGICDMIKYRADKNATNNQQPGLLNLPFSENQKNKQK